MFSTATRLACRSGIVTSVWRHSHKHDGCWFDSHMEKYSYLFLRWWQEQARLVELRHSIRNASSGGKWGTEYNVYFINIVKHPYKFLKCAEIVLVASLFCPTEKGRVYLNFVAIKHEKKQFCLIFLTIISFSADRKSIKCTFKLKDHSK